MLEKIKLLLNITNEAEDELLTVLIALCKDEATVFCNLNDYSEKLNSAVIAMVIERYNKIGTEGISAVTTSGTQETYLDGYSEYVLSLLRKYRKVRCV